MISTDMIKIIPKKDIDTFVTLFYEKLQPYRRTVSDTTTDCKGDKWTICPHCGKVEHTRIDKKTNESELISALRVGALIWVDCLNTLAFMVFCRSCRMRFYATVYNDTLKFIPVTAKGDFVDYDESGESYETNFSKGINFLKSSTYFVEPKPIDSENNIAYHYECFRAIEGLFAYSDTSHEINSYWKNKRDIWKNKQYILDTFINPNT
jgi:hypothetical protein